MVHQSKMKLLAKGPHPSWLRSTYYIDLAGKESLASIYFNNEGGIISDDKSKLEDLLKKLHLNIFDLVLLEKRSSEADLSIGKFKLNSDRVESIRSDLGAHYLIYKKEYWE